VATNLNQSRYLADTVNTATPAQLVVMLYDRLGLDLRRATESLENLEKSPSNPFAARVAAAPHLLHAQQILAELLASLKTDAWDGADNLAGIYSFLINGLVSMSLAPDPLRLKAFAEIIAGLRTAWQSAATQLRTTAVSSSDPAESGAWVA
jgi:flagellar protein FliS